MGAAGATGATGTWDLGTTVAKSHADFAMAAPLLGPDGRAVRGAKKRGYTDHLATVHLIPNVGREAMLTKEVVRRQRPKPKPKPEAKPPPQARKEKKKKEKKRKTRSPSRSRSRSARRSRNRSRSCSRASSASLERRPRRKAEEAREAASSSAAPRTAEQRAEDEDIEAEHRRLRAQEQAKLNQLKEETRRREELDAQRKSKLKGAFRLNDSDEEEDALQKFVIPKKPMPNLAIKAPASSVSRTIDRSRLSSDQVTAANLDGTLHDHRFSHVWKDWSADKGDDPGEIAKQLMKIAAIKRRGYDNRRR